MLLIGIAGANAVARERVARAMRDAEICSVSLYVDAPAQRFGAHTEVARRMHWDQIAIARHQPCPLPPPLRIAHRTIPAITHRVAASHVSGLHLIDLPPPASTESSSVS